MRWRRSWLLLLLLCLPQAATAGRAVVLDFSGSGRIAKYARASLIARLIRPDGISLLDADAFRQAAAEAGVARSEVATSLGILQAAAVAAVDAVVVGKVYRKRRRWRVRLAIYDANGEVVFDRSLRLGRSGQIAPRDLERIVARLRDLVGTREEAVAEETPEEAAWDGGQRTEVEAPVAGDGAADAEGDTADGEGDTPGDLTESSVEKPPAEDSPGLAKGNTGDETAPAAEPIPEPLVMHAPPARTGEPPAADASPSDSDLGETDWAREEPPPVTEPQPYVMPGERPGHLPPLFRLPVVSVRAVAKTTQRAYSLEGQFTRVNYAMGSFEFFPELGLAVDAFPLSTLGGAVEGLGVSGRFTRGFLVSQFADQAGQLQRLDTPVQRWHADLRYLFRFAPAQRASTALGVRLGYGVSEFLVPVANAVFTGVHHGGLRAGLELRQPLFPPFAVLEVRAVALPLVQPGADEARYYGPNASGFGWQVAGGLYGGTRIVGRGIVYGLWGELTGYLDTFQGTGTRDTDARAQESYVSLGMSLGYAY